MYEAKNMEHAKSTGRLRVALIGPEKNGKSILTTTAPGIKLDLDYDQRADALAGKKDVYAITLKDPGFPLLPQCAEETLDIITGLEKSLDLSNLLDAKGNKFFPNAPEGTMVQNLIHDSIFSLAKSIMQYELYNNKDLRRDINFGKFTAYIPKSYDSWNAETTAVTNILMRSFALPINVFCVFHETAEEAVDSTDEKPKYTGRVSIYPVRYRSLLKYFNEVWRVKLSPISVPTGVRYLPRVYPLPDFAMDAATTMLLDAQEEPDIAAMIRKHEQRLSSNGQPSANQPPVQVAGLAKK